MNRIDTLDPHKTPTSTSAQIATAIVAALLTAPLWWLLIALLQQLGTLDRPLQPPDDTRLSLWLGVSLLLLCWAPARRIGQGLVARFDSVLLQPPASVDAAMLSAPSNIKQQLRDWCFDGAGSGAAPLLLPNAIPAMDQPMSVAAWEMAADPELAAQNAELNAFMCQLDGSGLLMACSTPWAGRWLRLRIKLREVLWWRTRRADDPWDCGFLRTDEAAIAQLRAFLPRRPTLIVLQDAARPRAQASLMALREQQHLFRQPVRILVMGPFSGEDFGAVFRIQPEVSRG
jgi:hypothetical protein